MGDLFRGCHRLKRTDENISKCATALGSERTQGIHKISWDTGLSSGTVQRIFHRDLELTKCVPKCIPHELTEKNRTDWLQFAEEMISTYTGDNSFLDWILTTDESWFYVNDPRSKQESMEWLQKGVNRSQVVRKNQFGKKVMFIPFFDAQGLVYWEYFHNMMIKKEVFHQLLQQARTSVRVRHGHQVWT